MTTCTNLVITQTLSVTEVRDYLNLHPMRTAPALHHIASAPVSSHLRTRYCGVLSMHIDVRVDGESKSDA